MQLFRVFNHLILRAELAQKLESHWPDRLGILLQMRLAQRRPAYVCPIESAPN